MKDWTFADAGRIADELIEKYELDPIEDLVAVSIDIWGGRLNLHTDAALPGVKYVSAAFHENRTHYRSTFEHNGTPVDTVYVGREEEEAA